MEKQVTSKELLDFRARVESYHNSKDVLLPDEVRKSYLESLCKTHEEKAKFKAIYKELFPEDAETLAEIEKMMKKEQEKYPKDIAEAMVITANDLSVLFARAFKVMLELAKAEKEKKSSLSVSQTPERQVAVSEIDYDGLTQVPEKSKKKQKRPSFFARRRERKQNKKKQIETVSMDQIKKEKVSPEQKQLEDKRLELYNENVKQRGLANQRSFAMQKSNDRVMSK